ncbi:MAG: NlpC/P60 family protein [Selenomonadaceae bacterium]|jgi:cell wall-associated NlpC family hydrolase
MTSHRPLIYCLTTVLITLLLFSATAFAAPILKLHSHGHDVSLLQKELKRLNYMVSSPDGNFDESTKKAVLEFQRDQKLKINGIVDGNTWRALKKASPASKKLPSGGSPLDFPAGSGIGPDSPPFVPRSQVNGIVATAKKYIGTPYKFGGATPKAFDCSGYLQYVFAQNSISLPRTADAQYKLGLKTAPDKLETGDLVFFSTYEKGASHCGIYLGNGEFIHASSSKGVRIDALNGDYWKEHFYGGKHIIK